MSRCESKYVPGLIDCVFVQPVMKSDVEEFAECFGAEIERLGPDRQHARFKVEEGREEEFLDYCVDDVMVKSSGRVKAFLEEG